MKTLAVAVLALTINLINVLAIEEVPTHIKASALKCDKIFNNKNFDFVAMLRTRKLPKTGKEKCMVACFLKELGARHKNEFNLEVFKELSKNYDEEKFTKEISFFENYCIEEVNEQEIYNDCELAYSFLECMFNIANKVQLPLPKLQ